MLDKLGLELGTEVGFEHPVLCCCPDACGRSLPHLESCMLRNAYLHTAVFDPDLMRKRRK